MLWNVWPGALDDEGAKVPERVVIVSFDGLPVTGERSLGIRSLAAPIDTMPRLVCRSMRGE